MVVRACSLCTQEQKQEAQCARSCFKSTPPPKKRGGRKKEGKGKKRKMVGVHSRKAFHTPDTSRKKPFWEVYTQGRNQGMHPVQNSLACLLTCLRQGFSLLFQLAENSPHSSSWPWRWGDPVPRPPKRWDYRCILLCWFPIIINVTWKAQCSVEFIGEEKVEYVMNQNRVSLSFCLGEQRTYFSSPGFSFFE